VKFGRRVVFGPSKEAAIDVLKEPKEAKLISLCQYLLIIIWNSPPISGGVL
jgi:hypothetical protein